MFYYALNILFISLLTLKPKERVMPHCIIEYSEKLTEQVEVEQFLSVVFKGALRSKLFDKSDIKARAVSYVAHKTGADNQDFIHVTVKILAGRTAEQRAHLSTCVLQQLNNLDLSSVSLSVEICDIDTESYRKVMIK